MQDSINAETSDWHPADIKAELEKCGWSLRRLSTAHNYHPQTLRRALRCPYPKAESIIANAIGRQPWDIWPSRYAGRDTTTRQNSKLTSVHRAGKKR